MNLGKISAKHSGVDLTDADRASGVKSESAYPCPCGQRILGLKNSRYSGSPVFRVVPSPWCFRQNTSTGFALVSPMFGGVGTLLAHTDVQAAAIDNTAR